MRVVNVMRNHKGGISMNVAEVMTTNIDSCSPESTCKEVAMKMKELDVGAVPICENEKLVGIQKIHQLSYLKGLICSSGSPMIGISLNGPPPSASSLPVCSLAPVKLAPDMSAIFTSASVTFAPVTSSPCI